MTMTYQPSLEDLGLPLSSVTFCVIDLETTGGGADDTITEVGAVKVRGGQVVGEFSTLVNPGVGISPFIAVLTGITNQMVAGAPRLPAILPGLLEFMRDTVIVAHNARFDVGFLKRACALHGYEWPGNQVIDTVALARHALLRDEVPNCKLATLAAHFNATTQPNHRALSDARATVDVLHGLLERVGNLGVSTLDDLREFALHVSPQRRAKRTWASALPHRPGVYFFRNGDDVLYVGKSTNLRRRVGSYFTAAERRPRMEEMIRVATGVEYIETATPLEAEVRELRMINAHAPRYNRRSRRQDKLLWVKITSERFPRLSVVTKITDQSCLHWGPFSSRQAALDACAAIYDAYPLRQCTRPLSQSPGGCVLGELGRCLAPCRAEVTPEAYSLVVAALRAALMADIRPALARMGERVTKLSQQLRYEEAGVLSDRARMFTLATMRWHRLTSLARCPEIVAAEKVGDVWQIHVIRYGRLVAAAAATPGFNPRRVAEDAVLTSETVAAPPPGLPASTVEEAERVAAWLERPGVRLIEIEGDWSWPANIGVNLPDLPAHLLGVA